MLLIRQDGIPLDASHSLPASAGSRAIILRASECEHSPKDIFCALMWNTTMVQAFLLPWVCISSILLRILVLCQRGSEPLQPNWSLTEKPTNQRAELFARSGEKQSKHCPIKSDYTQTHTQRHAAFKCSFHTNQSIPQYFLPSEEKLKCPFDIPARTPECEQIAWTDSI